MDYDNISSITDFVCRKNDTWKYFCSVTKLLFNCFFSIYSSVASFIHALFSGESANTLFFADFFSHDEALKEYREEDDDG